MKTKQDSEHQLREALAKIAELAASVAQDDSTAPGNGAINGLDHTTLAEHPGCTTIKALPKRLADKAAEVAIKINPANATSFGALAGMSASNLPNPMELTLLVNKYWGPAPRRLTVSFMEPTVPNLRDRILSHMNAWATREGISFAQTTGVGQVRISLKGSGYWSYLGTDILLIPKNRPTMNLQGFSMNTPESEYKRVVRHETGHTLGFPHEHMRQELISRIDPQKAYAYFLTTYGWTKEMVDSQVLTPLQPGSFIGTPPDQTSIMCYQLPGSITKDGKPILGGLDINATDYTFAAKVYPKAGSSPMPGNDVVSQPLGDDWSEAEDVSDADIDVSTQESVNTSNGTTGRSAAYEVAPADN